MNMDRLKFGKSHSHFVAAQYILANEKQAEKKEQIAPTDPAQAAVEPSTLAQVGALLKDNQVFRNVDALTAPITDYAANNPLAIGTLLGGAVGGSIGLGSGIIGRRKGRKNHALSRAMIGTLLGAAAGTGLKYFKSPFKKEGAETPTSKYVFDPEKLVDAQGKPRSIKSVMDELKQNTNPNATFIDSNLAGAGLMGTGATLGAGTAYGAGSLAGRAVGSNRPTAQMVSDFLADQKRLQNLKGIDVEYAQGLGAKAKAQGAQKVLSNLYSFARGLNADAGTSGQTNYVKQLGKVISDNMNFRRTARGGSNAGISLGNILDEMGVLKSNYLPTPMSASLGGLSAGMPVPASVDMTTPRVLDSANLRNNLRVYGQFIDRLGLGVEADSAEELKRIRNLNLLMDMRDAKNPTKAREFLTRIFNNYGVRGSEQILAGIDNVSDRNASLATNVQKYLDKIQAQPGVKNPLLLDIRENLVKLLGSETALNDEIVRATEGAKQLLGKTTVPAAAINYMANELKASTPAFNLFGRWFGPTLGSVGEAAVPRSGSWLSAAMRNPKAWLMGTAAAGGAYGGHQLWNAVSDQSAEARRQALINKYIMSVNTSGKKGS